MPSWKDHCRIPERRQSSAIVSELWCLSTRRERTLESPWSLAAQTWSHYQSSLHGWKLGMLLTWTQGCWTCRTSQYHYHLSPLLTNKTWTCQAPATQSLVYKIIKDSTGCPSEKFSFRYWHNKKPKCSWDTLEFWDILSVIDLIGYRFWHFKCESNTVRLSHH